MGKSIIKLSGEGRDFYLEWSTIVDAPVTYGMSLEEFEEYYKEEYGNKGINQLPARLERVERTGCSAFNTTLDSLLACNKAGDNEVKISKEEIYRKYCLERPIE